jgi:CrcB protein
MNQLWIVALGGAVGSSLRHLTNLASLRLLGPGFPWGTLTVNILGCFAMGLTIELLGRRLGGSPELRLFIATGVLGGYTTFSAFSLDFATLTERGAIFHGIIYLLASVVLSIGALFAGLWLARSVG